MEYKMFIFVILHTILIYTTWAQNNQTQGNSICTTLQYRSLSASLQNEHQCMLLEKLNVDFENGQSTQESLINDAITRLESINKKLDKQILRVQAASDIELNKKISPSFPTIPLIRECNELNLNGIHVSGVYPVKFSNGKVMNVWCDMQTERGGWTVIQRRQDGSINFTRNWNEYAFGFGNANTEYWLGNEYIHLMTRANNFTLRIDLWDWEGDHAYAKYEYFALRSESSKYRLKIRGYSGTAGDSLLGYQKNMKFSTYDRDNDKWHSSCARKDESGWWYRDCGYSTLNGLYVQNGPITISPDGLIKGIIWYHWKRRYSYSLKKVEMKIKPSLAIKVELETLAALEARPPTTLPSTTTDAS